MKKQTVIKARFRGVVFVTLLIAFDLMYMRTAVEQYTKGGTTISQTSKKLSKLKSPTFIFCLDPPFKPSFFKNHSVTNLGVEKYFWVFPHTRKMFENHSAPELYMEMSHHLGSDWKLLVVEPFLDR